MVGHHTLDVGILGSTPSPAALISGDGERSGVIEEDDGDFFGNEFLQFGVDGFTGRSVGGFTAVFEKFVSPGPVEMSDIGALSRMPEIVLIWI